MLGTSSTISDDSETSGRDAEALGTSSTISNKLAAERSTDAWSKARKEEGELVPDVPLDGLQIVESLVDNSLALKAKIAGVLGGEIGLNLSVLRSSTSRVAEFVQADHGENEFGRIELENFSIEFVILLVSYKRPNSENPGIIVFPSAPERNSRP